MYSTVYLDSIQNSYKSMTNIYFLLLSFLSNTIEINVIYHLSSFNIKKKNTFILNYRPFFSMSLFSIPQDHNSNQS